MKLRFGTRVVGAYVEWYLTPHPSLIEEKAGPDFFAWDVWHRDQPHYDFRRFYFEFVVKRLTGVNK